MYIAELFDWFENSREFVKLAQNSSTAYGSAMMDAEYYFGSDYSVYKLTPATVDEWYASIKSKSSANRNMKVMRRIWNVAKRHGLVASNPFEKMGIAELPSRKVRWTKEDVDKIVTVCLESNDKNMAVYIMLCYHLCQRPGDMYNLQWSNYNSDGIITFIQEKTGTTVAIPVSIILEDTIRKYGSYTTNTIVSHSRTKAQYIDQFNAMKYYAGINKELQMRDLRRSGLTEMAEAGATDEEIMAISGHKDRQMLNIYVIPTLTIAINGMNKRFKKGVDK